jgi:hypothetical protein
MSVQKHIWFRAITWGIGFLTATLCFIVVFEAISAGASRVGRAALCLLWVGAIGGFSRIFEMYLALLILRIRPRTGS